MHVEHRFQVSAKCPVDDRRDLYTVFVRTNRVIKVEDILAAVEKQTKEAVFQEDLANALAKVLGCEVETQGYHGEVFTTVVCGGNNG